jgi:hypothetical protein
MTQNENHQQEIWSLWDPFIPAEHDCPPISDECVLKPGELRPCVPEDRNIEIGVYPECQEIPVRSFCLGLVSRQD